MSVLLAGDARTVEATVTWGDYSPVREVWKRTPRLGKVMIDPAKARQTLDVPGSDGLFVFVRARPLPSRAKHLAPPGLAW